MIYNLFACVIKREMIKIFSTISHMNSLINSRCVFYSIKFLFE